jgi:hypothetical protein
MSYNGSGTFQINTSGQPVVAGTVISSTAFNALTADLATGLSTAITKDGQSTTTVRIPFAAGINSTLVTDSTGTTTGSIITAGGVGIAKALYVGTTANVAGAATLSSTLTYGGVTLTNAVTGTGKMVLDTSPTITGLTANGVTATLPVINNIKMGYSTTATAAGTTTLTVSSNYRQFFTGTLAQTIVLPVTSTLVTGMAYEIENNSTGLLTVNSSGGNLVGTIPAGVCAHAVCIGTTLTTAADWDWDYISTTTITGTGANVLGTSPTITTPTISQLSSAAATALTLQSAGTTAITVDTSQNVGIGTTAAGGTLNVLSNSGSAVGIDVLGRSSDNLGTIRLLSNNAGTNYGSFRASASSVDLMAVANVPLTFFTNNTERMRIDSAGNVLVGTTSQIRSGFLSVSGIISTNNNINWGPAGNGRIFSDVNWGCIFQADRASPGAAEFLWQNAGGTERMRIDTTGNVTVPSVAGLGYGTGAGGTVTQGTSRTTAVTINKPTGAITMFTAAGSLTWSQFTVNNSLVAATDTIIINQKSGAVNYYVYQILSVSAGSFNIGFASVSGVSSDAPILNFTIIKGVTA